ncbi:hypothetical protein [Nitrospirillum amazonense]|uniref:hypothetical protein n=1 Tax=Nitrospirillum amazonense TaxID=28077 RepID=UPI0024124B79|nr:hypothetical protein [Nitrospirillum amazonense]MDG3442427.1 hypothetical protein [Nitrospirillum amazonense]
MSQTDLFGQLIGLVGFRAAMDLSRHWGGRSLYIPKQPSPGSPLVAVVGAAAAAKLAREYGGADLAIPITQGKRARVWHLRRQGMSVAQIARVMGYTERAIYYILAEPDPDPEAPPLLALLGKV